MSITIPSPKLPCYFSYKHGSLPVTKHNYYLFGNHRSNPLSNIKFRVYVDHVVIVRAKGNSNDYEQGPPSTSKCPLFPWKRWILGLILSIILPSCRRKWEPPLFNFRNKVYTTLETVETVAEVVEDVAEAVDKLVDEVESKLPKDSRLRENIEMVENIAKEVDKKAELAQQLVDQVRDAAKELDATFKIQQRSNEHVQTRKDP